MRSDEDIKRDVELELKWDPDIDASNIAVLVKDGVVTLTGYVRSYAQKWQAERDAKRVAGVVGLANDIEVRVPTVDQKPDPELAKEAVAAIRSQLPYSADSIKVLVDKGWITLEGTVDWKYQKDRAEEAVRRIKGVKGVINSIAIKPSVSATAIKEKIEEALKRDAEVDARRIIVEATGSEVILKGSVSSWHEREEAERAAWLAPGVTSVINRITISPKTDA